MSRRRNSIRQKPDDVEVTLQQQLDNSGHGSILRGWRYLMDPDGELEVPLAELEQACLSLRIARSPEELAACENKDETSGVVKLSQLLPDLGELVKRFRQWLSDRFGSHSAWFDSLDANHKGQVGFDSFVKACHADGFTANHEELKELYGFCDILQKDAITKELTVFLEADESVRKRELTKLKMNTKYERDKMLISCYNVSDSLPTVHRLAIRPWVKHKYEALPTIARKRVVTRDNALKLSGLQARASFIRHLRSFHGTEVRAWRRGLDPNGKFFVSRSSFKHYCRKIQFEEDITALWISVDETGEGQLTLEQLSLHAADVMSTFHTWAQRSFGSCRALFDTPEALKRRKQRRPNGSFFVKESLSVNAFGSLLWAYGYPPLFGQDGDAILWYITTSLDYHGGSLISLSDMQWLDSWKPTAWLVAEPSEPAWREIRGIFETVYGNRLRAWRRVLDVNNLNKVSWQEFCRACHELQIPESTYPGAWRFLDASRDGYITLQEFCSESAGILGSFKEWAEMCFGSMQEAFRAMDADGGGSLSSLELRNACYKYKCKIDATLLFQLLTTNARTIQRKDFDFLGNWVSREEDATAKFDVITEELWREVITNHQAKAASRPDSASSVTSTSSQIQIHRPQVCTRAPARFGGPLAASTSSCIPADFALGTSFPVSPYAMSLRGTWQMAMGNRQDAPKSKIRRRAPLGKSFSDSSVGGLVGISDRRDMQQANADAKLLGRDLKEDDWEAVQKAFNAFAGRGGELDGKELFKMCEDTGLICNTFSKQDVDVTFASIARKSKKIGYEQFKDIVRNIATKRQDDVCSVQQKISQSDGPAIHATKTDNVRFHDDKSTYTGAHADVHGREGGHGEDKHELLAHKHEAATAANENERPWDQVVETFHKFAGDDGLDNKEFAKFCKDAGLVGAKFDMPQVDLVFASVCPKGRRKLDAEMFKQCCREIAAKMGCQTDEVQATVEACQGPVIVGTRGASKFHDDKSLYTGSHTNK